MNQYVKLQYKKFLITYLKMEYNLDIKNDKKPFKCPICNNESATLYPNNLDGFFCVHPTCSFEGDIFSLIKDTKNEKFTDEDIAHFLTHKFNVEIIDDVDDVLKLYEKNNFCIFPLEPESKNPQKGFMWLEKEYHNPKIWKDWTERGYGLAIRLGKVSKVMALDVDSDKTFEQIKDLLPEDTLIQETKRGKHYLFLYDESFEHIMHVNFRNKGYDMELRNNNAYIAVAPTSVEGEIRKWNNKKIQKMPEKLKELLLSLIDKDTKNVEEEIQEAITGNDLSHGLKGLDGCCNDTFIKYGGILRKKMNVDQVEWALSNFNAMLEDPMPNKDIKGIIRQLNKYQTYDKQELADEVLKRLEVIKVGTAYQIAGSLRKEIKDIEDVLSHLENENKVIHLGNRKYQLVNDIEWTTDTTEMSIPVDFNVPLVGDYGYFDWGNMIIIGGASGKGKTHLTGNIIKQLVDQNISPYLINTESGSKIGKITDKLGVPQGSYHVPKNPVGHALDVELVDNSVTIVDWLSPKDGNYAEMENTYRYLHEQLKKHNAFLIVLSQLRNSNMKFFAEDLVFQYGACVARYLWGNNGTDGENTLLQVEKMRDSRNNQQYFTIPMHYSRDTKVLEIRK